MEGDDIFATMDSLWFYSSVLQPPSNQKQRECAGELQRRQQRNLGETHRTTSGGSGQAPKGVKEEAVATEPRAAAHGERRAAARSCRDRDREWDEGMVSWQMEQRRRTRVAAAAARCWQAWMPPPGEGVAMKAHLKSWAQAVACSVR